jgi:polyvinyl alcohol dehydrogenase (cytochrome)
MRRAGAFIALLTALVLATVPPATAGNFTGCSWPMYGHDVTHSFRQDRRCSALGPVRSLSVVPSWFVKTTNSVTASPAVAGGVVYIGGWDGIFHAIDQRSGRQRWQFTISDPSRTAFGKIESSAAVVTVAGRRVVIFGGGATLYVLDAATGAQLASLCLDPRANPAVRCRGTDQTVEIESSPAVIPAAKTARIVVGMDLHNSAKTGRTGVIGSTLSASPWRLTPNWKYDPEANAAYTGSDLLTRGSGTGDGCSGIWSSPAVDAQRKLVFFGTSSCSVDGDHAGESLYGIHLDTGAPAWVFHAHYGPTATEPSERWDDDFGASPNLLPFGMVGDGSKDGWYYALDRVTGKLRWATHAAESGHVVVDFAVGGMIGSAATGTVRGEPAIFATSAISTPLRAPFDETPGDIDPGLLTDPGRLFSIHAIRVRDGKILWRSPLSRQSYGAASFSNGVVLVPSTFSSTINAIDADTGVLLTAIPVIGPSSSTPVVVGSSLVVGAGTSSTDVEYKTFGAETLAPYLGESPTAPLSGIWGYRILLSRR